ncbi:MULTISPECIES: heavy-metal-associated domain-containing protein [Asticcacaulis]|uniref:heavy-metal-associated domain-containing protein n=1 Tax=Asticcacaulis TaxID=76890 RepID=UPI001AE690C7|nr:MULTISPECIES: heavy-metal-associated domain-containing protein [Asticcacaulis]MBP2160489.1 copper chaperone [Asticcacaulis solisilvae]MDR6801534.1 copper chaperone [Asticcacaulis sp. BE141]
MRLFIENMTCGGCVRGVTKAVQSIDPTAVVDADVVDRRVDVTTQANEDDVTAAIRAAGFDVVPQIESPGVNNCDV